MWKLESVASTRRLQSFSVGAKRRRLAIEIVFCVVLPLFYIFLRYISEGHRYDIIENLGCTSSIYFTWVSIVVTFGIPGLVCLATAGFASE